MRIKQVIFIAIIIIGLIVGGYILIRQKKLTNNILNNTPSEETADQIATTSKEKDSITSSSSQDFLNNNPYEDKVIGFSIKYPKNWEIIGNPLVGEALYFSPGKTMDKALMTFNLTYGSIQDSAILDRFNLNDAKIAAGTDAKIDADVTFLASENYKFIRSENLILPNGQNVFLIEFNSGSNEMKSAGFQMFVNQKLTDGSIRSFRLIALSPITEWNQYKDAFHASFKTFIPLSPGQELLNMLPVSRNSQRRADIQQLYGAIEFYYINEGKYPVTLNVLVPKTLSQIPVDPLTEESYEYTINPSLNGYILCANLEGQEKYCNSR